MDYLYLVSEKHFWKLLRLIIQESTYKYAARSISNEDVLFHLLIMIQMKHLQNIDLAMPPASRFDSRMNLQNSGIDWSDLCNNTVVDILIIETSYELTING